MDIVLDLADHHVLTPHVYPVTWREDDVIRQAVSLFILTCVGGYMLYFSTAILSYNVLFDKQQLRHPHFLKDQIKLEIIYTCKSIPIMTIPEVPLLLLQVRGYSRLYDNVQDTRLGYVGILGSIVTFILFTDCLVYWIHRCFHHRLIYKHVHKYHHKWKIPSPFASHALHPFLPTPQVHLSGSVYLREYLGRVFS